jgi:hypothetical protein
MTNKIQNLCLCDAVIAALDSFRDLLDTIDHNTQWGDYQIEQRYGKRILKAYLKAEKAYQDMETYREDFEP